MAKLYMAEKYKTIAAATEAECKERSSRFLGFAYPVNDEEQIKVIINDLKSRFPDATHHCYAWILDGDTSKFRASDDGEPGNSAGRPILRQIQSFELTNVLVVVVRYFGGKKLGIPGLIKAYGLAAKMALEKAVIMEKQLKKIFSISSNSGESHRAYELARRLGVEIENKDSDGKMTFEISVDSEMLDRFMQLCSKYPNLVVEYQRTE
jgi:uncharacterized YigZ family protein